MNRQVWKSSSTKTLKSWGYEVIWNGIYSGKELHIRQGQQIKLKYYVHKDETLFVTRGKIIVEAAPEKHMQDSSVYPSCLYYLSEGDLLNIQAGCPYTVYAYEDSVVFEISKTAPTTKKIILESNKDQSVLENKKYVFNKLKDYLRKQVL